MYYSVICSITLVLTIMIVSAPPGLKNITAQMELLLTVAMMSRITLSLKKTAAKVENRALVVDRRVDKGRSFSVDSRSPTTTRPATAETARVGLPQLEYQTKSSLVPQFVDVHSSVPPERRGQTKASLWDPPSLQVRPATAPVILVGRGREHSAQTDHQLSRESSMSSFVQRNSPRSGSRDSHHDEHSRTAPSQDPPTVLIRPVTSPSPTTQFPSQMEYSESGQPGVQTSRQSMVSFVEDRPIPTYSSGSNRLGDIEGGLGRPFHPPPEW
jgi:hypothetical protein